LDYSNRELIISQICNGLLFINYKESLYLFKEPFGYIMLEYYQKRKLYETNCTEEGFLSPEAEEQMLKDHGLWDNDFEKKTGDLMGDLKKLKQGRSGYRFRSNELNKIDKTCKVIEIELEKMNKIKRSFFDKTSIYQADLRARQWLLFKCLLLESGEPVWSSWDDFENETDFQKVIGLCGAVFYTKPLSTSEYREIARTEPWRSAWRTSCKTGTPLFDKSSSEFTESQKMISYWSLVYDNVYDSMDCPAQDIIDDDDQLDDWFEEQSIKVENSRKEKDNESSSVDINKKIAGMSEVFIPVDTPEDAKRVYNELNSPAAKKTFRTRQQVLAKEGRVTEANMPDTKQKLSMQATNLSIDKIKNT